MNKSNAIYCIIFSLISLLAKAERVDSRIEIGILFYDLSLEERLKELNHILAQENFPTIKYMDIRCGTFTLNSRDQKQSVDFKLGGSHQMLKNDDRKTRLQNIMLIFEYRYNLPLRNKSWVFYPALAYGITYGNLSLTQVNQRQFDPSAGNPDLPDYFEKKYAFFTGFIQPKVGINYLFGINWLKTVRHNYSVGIEIGHQFALNAKLHSTNHSFAYTNAPKFNLSSFTLGFNFKMRFWCSAAADLQSPLHN